MGEFFHGWKRKVGCITLLLACLFCVAWLRSDTIADKLTIKLSLNRFYSLASDRHGISFISEHRLLPTKSTDPRCHFNSSQDRLQPHPLYLASSDDRIEWRWKWRRFDLGRLSNSTKVVRVLIVPHLVITFGLIVLSFFFVIRRSRSRIQVSQRSQRS